MIPAGQDGIDGQKTEQLVPTGPTWSDGINCWDLNGNGVGDLREDVNGDGNYNALDCQGSDQDWYECRHNRQSR